MLKSHKKLDIIKVHRRSLSLLWWHFVLASDGAAMRHENIPNLIRHIILSF